MRKILICALALLAGAASLNAQIQVVGHRGARFNTKEEPETPFYENTLLALTFCQTLGIYGAEFDVQLTSDGQIIVYHGPAVPGSSVGIQEMTFEEARKVVLPGGHQMPTLEEYLTQAMKHPETRLICEIKKQATPERETRAAEIVVETVKRMGAESQLEYTTFSPWILSEIHRLDPSAKVLFLDSGPEVHDPEWCKSIGSDAVSYDRWSLKHHPDWVQRAHLLGMEVTLWLANEPAVIDWALAHKVDYISSDHPEMAKSYLETVNP